MDISRQILSDIIVFMKYARYDKKKKRRETWEEIIDRYKKMMIKKYPKLKEEIEENCKYLYEKKVLPSARALQFGGKAMEKNPVRGFNCSAVLANTPEVFSEVMFLLLSGTGVGFSVQQHHIAQLPEIYKPKKKRRHLIGDSIEGWAEAVGVLIDAYTGNRKSLPIFDFSDIRPKGTPLKTSGGVAPGPDDLKVCLVHLQNILDSKKDGEKLTSLEVLDMMCHIASCVVSGGVRRSSLLALFSFDDEDVKYCKTGNWQIENPQRAMVNISASILRHQISEEEFKEYVETIKNSKFGEPGIFLTNSKNALTNPCIPSWAYVLVKKDNDSCLSTIKDLKIGDFIWTKEGWSKVINIQSSGTQEVYKYGTTYGSLYCTKEHNVLSNGVKVMAADADVLDVLTGPVEVSGELNPKDVMDGLVIGDGSVHKASNNLVYLGIGTRDQDYFDSEIKGLIKTYRPGLSEVSYEIDTTVSFKELPKTYERTIPIRFVNGNSLKKRGFLRGLFSANGSVCGNRVTLKATSKVLVDQVQFLLSSLGIHSYYTTNKEQEIKFVNGVYRCKQSYDVNITSDREVFTKLIGFIQKYKMDKIKLVPTPNIKNSYDVKERELVSIEEVFDITVDNTSHTFWCNGFNIFNCGEAALSEGTMFCNLTSINTTDINDQNEFNQRARVASFFGTLQAGFTDFHLLREVWKEETEKDALIGVSLAGVASGCILNLDVKEAATNVLEENERVAKLIGINKAARTNLEKPDGTVSSVLGCSSGIHAYHSPYYIRRVRVLKTESIYHYLKDNHPELIEDDVMKPSIQAVISIPIKAPDGAITRRETALQLFNRIKRLYKDWVLPGHRHGQNTHSISCTVTVKKHEWDKVKEWMWENRNNYASITLFPYEEPDYPQLPFEEITEEKYNELIKTLKQIDLSRVIEEQDNTKLQSEVACSGGSCTITEV